MNYNTTIAAVSTPPGIGALSIIRVSGDDSFSEIEKLVSNKEKFINSKPNELKLYNFMDITNSKIIDEVMIVKFKSPNSYTGEDMVEITCHGGEFIVKRVLNNILKTNIIYAERGEFTKRAFINGKKNLIEAESINGIIYSKNEIEADNALLSYFKSDYNKKIKEWENIFKSIIRNIESEIEFNESDDILEIDLKKKINNKIKELIYSIENELKKRKKIKVVEKGITIAIVGLTNSGKSTIMNSLLDFDRAIISEKKGTTTDFITENIIVNGNNIILIDTAGLNITDDFIEKKGIEKTIDIINSASYLLFITTVNDEFTDSELDIIKKSNVKIILNKKDIQKNFYKEEKLKELNINYLKISALEENTASLLKDELVKIVSSIYKSISINSVVINTRQERILEKILLKLKSINIYDLYEEVLSYELKTVLNLLKEFTGEFNTEELLNGIFNEFCIGK